MRSQTILALLVVCVIQTYGQTLRKQMCNKSPFHEAVIQPDADAFIAGLFAMHGKKKMATEIGCGDIQTAEMQSYEAIRWALDRLNKQDETLNGEFLSDSYIPGVKIGMIARDYCADASNAVAMADELFPQFRASDHECSMNNKLLLGLIGASNSDDTKMLEHFARNRNLPLISYTSSAPELSDAQMFPNLMRTIPPDGPLTNTVVKFIEEIGWKYVVVVYTDNSNGRGAYREIRPQLATAGICLTAAVSADPDNTTRAAINETLRKVLETDTTGVIYLGNPGVIEGVLEFALSYPGAGSLQWVVTDSVSIGDRYNNMLYPRVALSYPGAGSLQWVVTDSVSIGDRYNSMTYSRGLVAVVPAARKITEFEDHWVRIDNNNPSPENPWYKEQYMTANDCNLAGFSDPTRNACVDKNETSRRQEFVQDQFVLPAVHAVFTYARALKQAHAVLCGGQRGMCDALKQLQTSDFYTSYLRNINFMYGKAERIESLASFTLEPYFAAAEVQYMGNDLMNPSFEIFNFNTYRSSFFKFTNIGTYIDDLLEVITSRLSYYDNARTRELSATPSSNCPTSPCRPCLGAFPDPKYVYVPGNVMVTGVFNIHWMGPDVLSCGAFNDAPYQGIQAMEAFIYAINRINNDISPSSGRLPGVTMGALGFDGCYSPLLANHFITEVHRQERRITDMSGNNVLDPNTVEAFIGGRESYGAITMAELMNSLMRPMVGVETVTEYLNDKDMYKYFVRANYDVEYWCRAVVNVAKRNGWKYLQSVYHEDRFGVELNDKLKEVAAEEGICIVASYAIESDIPRNIVSKLMSRPAVKPVVALLEHYGFRNLLMGMKEMNAGNDIQLISLVGDARASVEGYEDIINGMFSIEFWSPTLDGFRQHLQLLDMSTYMTNPWAREWYENNYNCSFTQMDGRTMCGTQNMFTDPSSRFQLNTDAVAIIYGVQALSYAIHETLVDLCGQNYNGICGNFINARNKGEMIVAKFEQVTFTDAGNEYMFMERMGNIPFRYFSYNSQLQTFTNVGEYKPAEDYLFLQGYTLNSPNVESSCAGVCMECLYLFRYQKYMYVPGDLLIPAIFDVHYRGDSPYSCSDLRSVNGFQYTEAFRYAIDLINTKQSSVTLNGVTLGGLGFDGCTDPIRASALVTGMYSGAYPKPGTDLGEVDLELSDLAGWMTYDSESTINVATILQRFGIPIVTPGATSPMLDDKSMFTTFFRTIPSNSLVAEAMAKLSNLLGFRYVITLNAPEEGSREGVRKFREYAGMEGICIGASYEFVTDGSASQIMGYILQSTTAVVVVFSPPDSHIVELLNEKATNPQAAGIVFIANMPWTAQVQDTQTPIGTINFKQETSYDVESFRQFLANQIPSMSHPNPWLREFYENFYQCDLAGTYKYNSACLDPVARPLVAGSIDTDINVLSTINAVFAIGEAIHRTLQLKCGNNYNGVCSAFISDTDTYSRVMEAMDALQFTEINNEIFRFIEREADKKLLFTRFLDDGSENREGEFSSGSFNILLEQTLKLAYERVPATCVGECAQCDLDMSGEEQFIFEVGDIYIGALFDIHKMGSTPYTCGEINDIHGFELLEAFNWALGYVNSKQGIFSNTLSGVKLGSLVYDTCLSPVRAGNLVANFHARNFEIRTPESRIDPSLIDMYIGPMMSEASIRVADVLQELGIPQIGYGASTLELRDQRKYRYFIRTVPADDKQARALISFLKKYELNNIQLISQFSTIGEFGRAEFKRLASLNRICVSEDYVIGQEGMITDEVAMMTANMIKNNANARVVVLIMDNPYIVLRHVDKDSDLATNYAFIATDRYGFGIMGYENLEGVDNLMRNRRLVTLDLETADFPELDMYLEARTPENYMSNPWYMEYYQHINNCSLSGPNERFSQVCDQMLMGYSRAEKYVQDPQVLYVVNAVFAAALGIHTTLQQWCGNPQGGYFGICNILRTNGERREFYLENIKAVRFQDHTDQPFYFTPDGESDRGFKVYEPQNMGLSLHYIHGYPVMSTQYYWQVIGHYNDTNFLKMDVEYDPPWVSNCDAGDCTCNFPAYQPSRYMKQPSPLDLNIVYITNIHKSDGNMGCGEIDTGSNFRNLLAFLYAIQLVNANSDSQFPGSLQLGGVALDACSQPSRIGQDVYSLLSGEFVCDANVNEQVVPPSSVVAYMVTNSQYSIAASSMLSPLKITSISGSATSVELSDKNQHGYFLRTVPPDNIQALVVAQILELFNWDYVSVVYSEDSYGRSAVQTLLGTSNPLAPKFCFGRTVSMPMDANLDDAKAVIDQLNQQIGSRVVVTFVASSQVRLLLQATTEKGLNHRFLWLGSDTWADNLDLSEGYEETASGAITIQIRSEFSSGFREFVKGMSLNNRYGFPDDWFEDLYQTLHQCRILDSPVQKEFTQICTGDEEFTDDMIPQDPYVLHTIMNVFQIANGLSQIEACKSSGLTIASCLALQPDRLQVIYNSILNAQHNVLPDDLGDNSFTFRFTNDGYGDIGYNIFNYNRNLTSGQYEYMKIGSASRTELFLDRLEYRSYSQTDNSLPVSRCPIGSSCQCLDADGNSYPFSRQGTSYIITEEGQYVDPITGQLVTIEDAPEVDDRFRDIWAIIVATLAALGAFAALCMFVYLLVVYPVRGGTSILGYMLSFGIILMYILVFAFIVHATEQICALRRFTLGVVYSIVYSALFVKLVDCWRTKDKEDIYMVKYNKIGNPWGLFFSAVLLVLVQVMINAEWLILEAPGMERVIYNNKLWPRCVPDDFYDEGLVLSNVYVMFIIFCSVLVGLAAFGNDKNHWDCRWLTGCVVLTIPAWMVWGIVACLGEYKMRDAAVAIALLYNASVMLMCGPMRKLYLLNKYQALIEEEERKSQIAGSQRDYNSMYGHQYDNAPRMHDGDSVRGSSYGHDDVFAK